MNHKQKYKKRPESMIFNNERDEVIGFNSVYDRNSAMNTPLTKKMLTDINTENSLAIRCGSGNPGSLIYKSIFNSLEKHPNKENVNNITDNNINILKENDKGNYNTSNILNKKINKNQKLASNLKRKIQNVKNIHSEKTNKVDYYINHTKINNFDNVNQDGKDNLLLNNLNEDILNKDIKYQKYYTNKQNKNNDFSNQNIDYIVNTNFEDLNCENDINNGELKEIPKLKIKTINYQKSEDNLNKNNIIDKEEFMKNIKEINDLEFIDENKNELFTEKDNILSNHEILNDDIELRNKNIDNKSNTGKFYRNKNIIISNKIEKCNTMNKSKSPQSSFVSTTNNSNINNLKYNKNSYNNSNTNKNIRNASITKDKVYNLPNNLEDNKIKISNIGSCNSNLEIINIYGSDLKTNSNYNKKTSPDKSNYLLSKENKEKIHFSTLSNDDKERIEKNSGNIPEKNKINLNINNNIDIPFKTKFQNYNNMNNILNNNFDNINNNFDKSMGSNNYKARGNSQYINMSNNSDNYIELKEKYGKLKKQLNQKNTLIDNFRKIINEYKKKNDKLLEENKQLQENSKTKQITLLEKIKEYQKEIHILKNNIELLKRNNTKNNKNQNYNINIYNSTDLFNQINNLKEEIEKYKKENNNLKILAIRYKNKINLMSNSNQIKYENNLSNRLYSTKEKDKSNKKSYSVSKSKKRIRASSLSKKNFEEDDINSENSNHISRFILF